MINIAIENGPVEIVDVPIKKWWIFPVRYVRDYKKGKSPFSHFPMDFPMVFHVHW